MIPILDLLHRIQWDPAWRDGVFEIGYADRVARTTARVPFGALELDRSGRGAIVVQGDDGVVRRIPLHRVRVVWRDGLVIWERPGVNGTRGDIPAGARPRDPVRRRRVHGL